MARCFGMRQRVARMALGNSFRRRCRAELFRTVDSVCGETRGCRGPRRKGEGQSCRGALSRRISDGIVTDVAWVSRMVLASSQRCEQCHRIQRCEQCHRRQRCEQCHRRQRCEQCHRIQIGCMFDRRVRNDRGLSDQPRCCHIASFRLVRPSRGMDCRAGERSACSAFLIRPIHRWQSDQV